MAVHAAESTPKVLLCKLKQKKVALSLFLNVLIICLPVTWTMLKEY